MAVFCMIRHSSRCSCRPCESFCFGDDAPHYRRAGS
jgi:hypothetical protein